MMSAVHQHSHTQVHQPLRVRRLRDEAVLPQRAHEDDAGLDLASCEPVELAPGARAVVGTGVAIEIPLGWVGLVCPRSGLAARYGIRVVNAPGIIDAGYRGELRVVLLNNDPAHSFQIEPGDRIAQLVVVPVHGGAVDEVDDLSPSTRDAGGFGSTAGVSAQGTDMRDPAERHGS